MRKKLSRISLYWLYLFVFGCFDSDINYLSITIQLCIHISSFFQDGSDKNCDDEDECGSAGDAFVNDDGSGEYEITKGPSTSTDEVNTFTS